MKLSLQGGCLCEELRYQVDAELIDAGYCHCRLCQKSSGAPVLAWATIRRSGFRYTRGEAAVFYSSPTAQREHCARCGTQLVFRSTQAPDTLDITLASLDDPAAVTPQYHIWTDSQIGWLQLGDSLPRHADEGPDVPA